jgi:hypothetical protein
VGGYWKQTIPTTSCSSIKCGLSLINAGWVWIKDSAGTTNSNIPPIPLVQYPGGYYWLVIACKTSSCELGDQILSVGIGNFKVAALGNAVLLTSSVTACDIYGNVAATFKWRQQITGGVSQYLDISVANNNFASGTFQSSGQLADGREEYTWSGLVANGTTYYWRINTVFNGYSYYSTTESFTTPKCTKLGSTTDYNNLLSFIDTRAAGATDPLTSVQINYIVKVIMVSVDPYIVTNSNLGLCHVDFRFNSIGILNFKASDWKRFVTDDGSTYLLGRDEGHGDDKYFSSGLPPTLAPLDGCWKKPGRDTYGTADSYETIFGPNIDAGAWNPYTQIIVAIDELKKGKSGFYPGCIWVTYKIIFYPQGCP